MCFFPCTRHVLHFGHSWHTCRWICHIHKWKRGNVTSHVISLLGIQHGQWLLVDSTVAGIDNNSCQKLIDPITGMICSIMIIMIISCDIVSLLNIIIWYLICYDYYYDCSIMINNSILMWLYHCLNSITMIGWDDKFKCVPWSDTLGWPSLISLDSWLTSQPTSGHLSWSLHLGEPVLDDITMNNNLWCFRWYNHEFSLLSFSLV